MALILRLALLVSFALGCFNLVSYVVICLTKDELAQVILNFERQLN